MCVGISCQLAGCCRLVVFVLLHVLCNDNFTSNYSARGRGREGRRSWRKSSRKKLNIQSVPKLDWEATFIIAAAVSVVWYSTLHEGARNRDWVRIQPYGGCRFGVVTYLVTCMLLRIQLQLNYGHRCLKTRAALLNPKFALLTLPVPGPVRGKKRTKIALPLSRRLFRILWCNESWRMFVNCNQRRK